MGRASWIWLAVVAAVGVLAVVVAYFLTSQFWMGLLLNVGTAAVLFSSLYLVERLVLERRVDAVREQITADTRAELDSVRHEVATSIEVLQTRFAEQLQDRHDGDRQLVVDAEERVGAQTIGALLARAAELKAVTLAGPRVAVPGQYERLRFAPSDEHGNIGVRIEEMDGSEVASLLWAPSEPADSLFFRLAEVLRASGRYPGDHSFDPAAMLRGLTRSIDVAIGSRTGRGLGPTELHPLIELMGDQWALTDYGIEAIGRHRYWIEAARVHDPNWFMQVSRKSWVDEDEFDYALETARALFPSPSSIT